MEVKRSGKERGETDKKRKFGRAWENEIRSTDLSGNATCNFTDTRCKHVWINGQAHR